ncbi:Pyridoxal phosphate-dependent transferase major region subdomain 2 [Penicillium hordei]|uniref:Pyridoxal phosphate-dependent transferase major region subdomain 2 n=1 Tax=Penicillium hordei TaxID=40994 RepID=A0AAD6GUK1_9EURO|nr:Pyridoxal phosphate-dependent transferase major region subdomain 2 [Penicillium hordei]KAJ5592291.1 Pyridoxal phosphate-dependent transferase major region subdomain 2 [Penicillium hordei]
MQGKVSGRGKDLAAQRPSFLAVLSDQWSPSSNPNGIVNLGLAENTLMHTEMVGFINSHLRPNSHVLTYGDGFSGSHKLKQMLCHFMNSQFSPHSALCSSHLVVTSGVSNALECCAWALADPGDFFMVGRPYFNAFRTTFGSRPGVQLLEVEFGEIDPFSMAAIQQYERAFTEVKNRGLRIKALVLCSPHNPLEYLKLCSRNGLHLISDEIYALSVWDNPRLPDAAGFKSVLSINLKGIIDPSLVHTVWGLSKDFGATGLRIGCLVSQSNKLLLEAAEGISLYNIPSSLADQVTTSLLLDDSFMTKYIAINRSRLADSYHFATKWLRSHGIPYLECNAAFFIWINLGAVVKDATSEDILARLRKEKIYIAAGEHYGAEKTGWFRLVFSHPLDVLEEGLKRIIKSIQ